MGNAQRYAREGWEKQVFGAWRVNGTFTAHSGTPYTVRVFSKNPACQNVPGVNSERADQIRDRGASRPDDAGMVQYGGVQRSDRVLRRCAAKFRHRPWRVHDQFGPFEDDSNSGVTACGGLDISWNTTNLLNHVNYSGLSTVLGSSTFGQITGAAAMRTMQFPTRVNF